MERKVVSGIMLTLLLIGMLTFAFDIQPVRASGTIYIRPDGSVEGTDKIQRDGDVYTFTDNIYDSIVVEIDNIVVDGAAYTVQGTGAYGSRGIDLSQRNNVTIRNMEIRAFYIGIRLDSSNFNSMNRDNVTNNWFGIYLDLYSSTNYISKNNITNNSYGIYLLLTDYNSISENNISNNTYGGIWSFDQSHHNIISLNNITWNDECGIYLFRSSNNSIFGNNITNNGDGIDLHWSSDNNNVTGNNIVANKYSGIFIKYSSNISISGNNITNNGDGVYIDSSSNSVIYGNNITNNRFYGLVVGYFSGNKFYHNNLINNSQQIKCTWSMNTWDDGYPSAGNYWSDYSERYPSVADENQGENQDILGSDGIWDLPYEIDADNIDYYPLVEPWSPKPSTSPEALEELIETIEAWELPKGTENSLISKLDGALHLYDIGNDNGEIHKLMDFINQTEAQRDKKLTDDQADYLISEAQRIIDLIQG